MSLRDIEDIVQRALGVGLVGPDMRRQLLEGLPMGFVYSLPTVSRPIDQLRFDLMELARTPRLIGLDKPPFAVWLANAIELALTRGDGEAARIFAGKADALLGGDRERRYVASKLRPKPAPRQGVGPPAPRRTPGPQPPHGSPRYDVFIAISHQDRPFAEQLHEVFEARGLSSFVDSRCLKYGDNWMVEIPRALKRSRVVLVLVSDKSPEAWYQEDEIAAAVAAHRSGQVDRLIPVLLDGLSHDALPYGMQKLNSLRLASGATAGEVADRLMPSLATPSSKPAPGPAPPPSRQPLALAILMADVDPSRPIYATTAMGELHSVLEPESPQRLVPGFSPAAHPETVQKRLLERPDIVQFFAHGSDAGMVLHSGTRDETKTMSAEDFERMLHGPAGRSVSVALLIGCQTAALAERLSTRVPMTVGTTRAIDAWSGMAFCVGFYRALMAGLSARDAVREGRNAVASEVRGAFADEADAFVEFTRPGLPSGWCWPDEGP